MKLKEMVEIELLAGSYRFLVKILTFRISSSFLLIVLLTQLFLSCQSTIKPELPFVEDTAGTAMGLSLVQCPLSIAADNSADAINEAVKSSISYYQRLSSDTTFKYGQQEYTPQQMISSLYLFLRLVNDKSWSSNNYDLIKQYFDCYQMVGEEQALLTGYYTPLIKGSLQKTSEYNVPIYSLPADLKVLDLGKFRSSLNGRSIVYRQQDELIAPYFSRKQINEGKILEVAEAIAWVDSEVEFFFLQIQGSGILEDAQGRRYYLQYAGANGHDYTSIGSYMVSQGYMSLAEVSLYSLKEFLYKNPHLIDDILNRNASYVFYQLSEYQQQISGSLNQPLTAQRSAAFDALLLPKGSLVFIDAQIPYCDENGICQDDLQQFSKFLFNQDTGGAIKGYSRADIYFGTGKQAEAISGSLKHRGNVYFIVAKKEFLELSE